MGYWASRRDEGKFVRGCGSECTLSVWWTLRHSRQSDEVATKIHVKAIIVGLISVILQIGYDRKSYARMSTKTEKFARATNALIGISL